MTDELGTMRFLTAEASLVSRLAYAPYSNFHVGAAALTTSGAVVKGCNVENASYGLTLCAECALVSELYVHETGLITHIVVCGPSGEDISPCGRCRQVLLEHATQEAVISSNKSWVPLASLLPGAFLPDHLA